MKRTVTFLMLLLMAGAAMAQGEFVCGDTVRDGNGNAYATVQIGALCWTKSNMRAVSYADGSPIANAMIYNSNLHPDTTANLANFGRLYTWWSAVNLPEGSDAAPAKDATGFVRGVCPAGWRIPTVADIQKLRTYADEDLHSTDFWVMPNSNTNSTGFSEVPGGMFSAERNRFEGLLSNSYMWTDSSSRREWVVACNSRYFCDKASEENVKKGDGLSVRCVREIPFVCGVSTIKDHENNEYNTVQIGCQCWTRENMRCRTSPNGYLALSTGDRSYKEALYYDNDTSSIPLRDRGLLYNWPAAMDTTAAENIDGSFINRRGVCPEGWHVPTLAEWNLLINYLKTDDANSYGDTNINLAKSLASSKYWNSSENKCTPGYDMSGNNSTSFTAVPAGLYAIRVSHQGNFANFHTSTSYDGTSSYHIYLANNDSVIRQDYRVNKERGRSVRCLRDDSCGPTADIPKVLTTPVSCYGAEGITGGEIIDNGGEEITEKGVIWSKSSSNLSFAISDGMQFTEEGSGDNTFNSVITNLEPFTTYYVCAYATNSSGTAYGNIVTYKYGESCPGLGKVKDHEGNEYNTVQIGNQCWTRENMRCATSPKGYLKAGGSVGDDITRTALYYNISSSTIPLEDRGFMYNWAAAIDTIFDDTDDINVSFSNRRGICPDGWHIPSREEWQILTDYVSSQACYVCGDSLVNIGKALSSQKYWNIDDWYPENDCRVGNELSKNNATGFSAIPVGINYVYSQNPAGDIGSVGDFLWFQSSSSYSEDGVSSMAPYFRFSYVDTIYGGWKYNGHSVRCLKNDDNISFDGQSCPGTPTVTDVENNVYNTVQLGNQCWMKENLRTTKYADSTAITAGGSSVSNTVPYYYNTAFSNIDSVQRGYLYNWAAATRSASTRSNNPSNAQGICPTGWHLPSKAEWDTLTNYVSSIPEYLCDGTNANIAKALASKTGWSPSTITITCAVGNDTTANNKTGFSAVPVGRCLGSTFIEVGYEANFWSSTLHENNFAFSRYLQYNNAKVLGGTDGRNYGLSVRCLKDADTTATDNCPVITKSSCSIGVKDSVALTGIANNIIGDVTDYGFVYGYSRDAINRVVNSTHPKVTISHYLDMSIFTYKKLDSVPQCDSVYFVAFLKTDGCSETVYSDTVSFIIKPYPQSCGDVTDVDDNYYHTVQLGSQCWMIENLRTKHFKDGTAIAQGADTSFTIPYYYQPAPAEVTDYNFDYYGLYYNFASVESPKGICPEGWHVPTRSEWDTLSNYVGSQCAYVCGNNDNNFAKALSSHFGWKDSDAECAVGNNQSTNNITSFGAIPMGRYNADAAKFDGVGEYSYFWTSTGYGTNTHYELTNAWTTRYNRPYGLASQYTKTYGFPIRCLRDEATTPTVVIDSLSCPEAKTVTDHEGNVYATVKIGNQCWTRENLRTTTSPSTKTNLIPADGVDYTFTGKQARWYGNDSSQYAPLKYGLLYNWNAAVDTFNTTLGELNVSNNYDYAVSVTFNSHRRGICPEGWHVPSDAEWNTMEQTVSGSDWQDIYANTNGWRGSHAGKLASGDKWNYSLIANAPGDTSYSDRNKSGFSAFPVGKCYGSWFGEAGVNAYFWSSTQISGSNGDAWSRQIGYYDVTVYRTNYFKSNGFSVRCVKDENGSSTAAIPTVSTNAVSNIADTSASCGGEVTDDGGDNVTARGVCWSTSQNPTIDSAHTSDGSGMGSFGSNITGLTAGTTYYVRAYATNSEGTAYGNEVSFTTVVIDEKSCPEAKTVTDHEGNVYATVKIGNQCWTRENLRTTTSPSTGKKILTSISYCSFSGKQARRNNGTPVTYGLLYNWNAAVDTFNTNNSETHYSTNYANFSDAMSLTFTGYRRGICPKGWHLPSVAEWDTLTNYVSSIDEYICGNDPNNYAKALASTTGWTGQGGACLVGNEQLDNNATRFSAFPAGFHSCYSTGFGYDKMEANFWSSSNSNSENHKAIQYVIEGNRSAASKNETYKSNSFSVRCVKDEVVVIDSLSCPEAKTVTDIEGNTYATVKIGEQCWMRQNMRATKYADGRSIPAGGDNTSNTEPYYYNNTSSGIDLKDRGYYYNWTAAMDSAISSNDAPSGVQGICPDGWHLPSDAEWDTLKNYVSSKSEYICGNHNSQIAKALASTTGWQSGSSFNECAVGNNLNTNNATGFSAVPAGGCVGSTLYSAKENDYFWSSTQSNNNYGLYRGLWNMTAIFEMDEAEKLVGFSVRCIRDVDVVIDTKSCPEAKTVTDYEGNMYATVKIGSQCWTRQNLRTTKYADGRSIPAGDGRSNTEPYYYNYTSSGIDLKDRGLLYNWTAAMDSAASSNAVPSGVQGICPTGWHVPSDAEWNILEQTVSNNFGNWVELSAWRGSHAGKLAGGDKWQTSSNVNAPGDTNYTDRNASGFSAVPAGYSFGSSFYYAGDEARFWTSTQYSDTRAWKRDLTYRNTQVFRDNDDKYCGYSVRCVKDEVVVIDSLSCPEAKTVTDIEGNTYATVKIGKQCWMRQNLRTKHYANGTDVPAAGGDIMSETEPLYYDYTSSGIDLNKRGYLYNWAAVMHNDSSSNSVPSGVQGICPTGWHVPSNAEWDTLTTYVGSQSTNILTNFTTVLSGFCEGWDFAGVGSRAYFWSSTQSDDYNAWYQSSNGEIVLNQSVGKAVGFSVRCLKDETKVSTAAVSNITDTSASCGGEVIADGGSNITARGVCWSTSPNPTVSDSHTTDGSGMGSFSSSITGLTASTTYYVRAYATNSAGTAYGNEVSFTTQNGPCPGAPTVIDVDSNVYNTVKIGNQCWMKENLRTTKYADGSTITAGGDNVSNTERYYYDYTSSGIDLKDRGLLYNWAAAMKGESSSNAVPSDVKGICPTGWHLPSYAEWDTLINYVRSKSQYICGSDNSQIAKALADSTGWQSNDYNCAVGNTQSTNNLTGFSAVPAGICIGSTYDKAGKYANFWSSTEYTNSFAWYCFLTDDQSNVTMTHRENIYGKSVRCVKDLPTMPTVSTNVVSNITDTSASCGGEVIANGGSNITARGVCWSTSPNPTVDSAHTSDGSGMGSFSSNITGLTAGTTYYVRAYATNSEGTAYGNEVSFTTVVIDSLSCPEAKTVTDIEGNEYATVQIGNQCWMRQNLRTKHYADGTAIAAGGNNTSNDIPYYYDNTSSGLDSAQRGLLYNWAAVMYNDSSSNAVPSGVQGICPDGWHVPSNAEWNMMERTVSGSDWLSNYETEYGYRGSHAGKLAGGDKWQTSSNANAPGDTNHTDRNASGFSAVPAGYCEGPSFDGVGRVSLLWSSTQYDSFEAWSRNIDYALTGVGRIAYSNHYGFSVRCVRNEVVVIDTNSCPEAKTVTDYEGNTYATVKIGNQCWMRQNMRATKYADGTAIAAGGDNTSDTEPYYYNYTSSGIDLKDRGYLYNWSAANLVCPDGWHLPSDAEWNLMEQTVSGSDWQANYADSIGWRGTHAGKLAGGDKWQTSTNYNAPGNTNYTDRNKFGFSAVPAGFCFGSSFDAAGIYAVFWSSTQYGSGNAWFRELHFEDASVDRDYYYKYDGLSVRCVKDDDGGSTVDCAPVGDAKPCPGTPIVYDHEGNEYNTVQIGKQCWTKENMRCTTSPSGKTAFQAASGSSSYVSPQYYDSESSIPLNDRGLLYNWAAAMDTMFTSENEMNVSFINRRGICPEGWHVPTDYEWTVFENYVNSQVCYQCDDEIDFIAKALSSTKYWKEDDYMSCIVGNDLTKNNATGFSAVPAGMCRFPNYYLDSMQVSFWTSTSASEYGAYFCNIMSHERVVTREAGNDKNTGYSVRCIKNALEGNPCPGAPTVIDADSNVYNTVRIGNQCWMKENLRTTKYADGSTITAGGNNESSTERYYYDYTTSGIDSVQRGYLYNWAAVMNGAESSNAAPSGVQGICPTGWHVPSYAEWMVLLPYLNSQNQYLCESVNELLAKSLASSTGWNSSNNQCAVGNNQSTNNLTGFSAVPAGYYDGSTLLGAGECAEFWSSTQVDNDLARYLNLYYDHAAVNRGQRNKNYANSVRCVKDVSTIPTVSTAAVSNITDTSATCGGNVTSDGGDNVTARGVCWSTSSNPTVNDSHTTDSSGMGSFTSNITGLTASTTYYVRAYATNSEGTAYGNEVTFVTSGAYDAQPCPGVPTVTDYDGNVYNTVQIGNKCWMKENLRTKHYADGTEIPAGGSSTSDAQPYYYDYVAAPSVALPLELRGYLYNWSAAMNGASSSNTIPSNVQGVCPTGWHLPSEAEWIELTDYVSSQSKFRCNVNDKYDNAKALASEIGWSMLSNITGYCVPGNDPSTNNATGFSAIPIAFCNGNIYINEWTMASFWSSTFDGNNVRVLRINENSQYVNYVGSDFQARQYGLSVRCVKDTGNTSLGAQPCPGTPTVTDVDNNVYNTVQIGNQCWMKENMRSTKYSDGTDIPAGGNNWSTTNPYYYDYTSSGIDLEDRGYLYNWAAANRVCPDGWHLPSDAEWNTMEKTVSGSDWLDSYATANGFRGSHAGKLAGGDKWNSSTDANTPGNMYYADRNASGFSAVPAGNCFSTSFTNAGYSAIFWSSTQYDSYFAWRRVLYYNSAFVLRDSIGKGSGYSVRCLKNNTTSLGTQPCPGTPTVTDVDNNVYNTVQIGDQCWMKENMRATKYSDGTAIPAGGSNVHSADPYYYDYTSSGIDLEERGYFYNWAAATRNTSSNTIPSRVQGICPDGWHVPSNAEWNTLMNYVGNQNECKCGDNSGNIAKALATATGWDNSLNTCATGNNQFENNATGFSAVPAGYCIVPHFVEESWSAYFWSSTEASDAFAWFCNLYFDHADVDNNNRYKSYPYSVRCLKDNNTSLDARPCPGTPTVTDVDNNTYNTVRIGNQCWMKENLRTKHYADGIEIPAGGSNTSSIAPYYYNYTSGIDLEDRGYLYNWPAATRNTSSSLTTGVVQGICPNGWHVPSDAEWDTLMNYVGNQNEYKCSDNSGNIAKALATATWWRSSYNTCATGNDQSKNNYTGFSAVPAGYYNGSSFVGVGDYAEFWSSTQYNSNNAYDRFLFSAYGVVNGEYITKNNGFSVRCLKDEATTATVVIDEKSCPEAQTVTDHEGNVYATVQIGDQCWMRDNMRATTSPSTGTYIVNNEFTSGSNIACTYTGKMARWYDNDSATYAPMKYGLLYNWNAAVDTFNTAFNETNINNSDNNAVDVSFTSHRRGICPKGWHLPTGAEWTTLKGYVSSQPGYLCNGNFNYIAKALADSVGWYSATNVCRVGYNQNENNATGFSANPAGYYTTLFTNRGSDAAFWTATQNNSILADYRKLTNTYVNIYVYNISKANGYSVRCLKDN